MNISQESIYLAMADYLHKDFFDLLDKITKNIEPENYGRWSGAMDNIPVIAELLDTDNDTLTKMFKIFELDIYYKEFGGTAYRIDFKGLFDYLKGVGAYEYVTNKDNVLKKCETFFEQPAKDKLLGRLCDTDGVYTKKWEYINIEKEGGHSRYTSSFNMERLFLNLYKLTGKTSFVWTPHFAKYYSIRNLTLSFRTEVEEKSDNPENPETRTVTARYHMPILSYVNDAGYVSSAELNPRVVDFLNNPLEESEA